MGLEFDPYSLKHISINLNAFPDVDINTSSFIATVPFCEEDGIFLWVKKV